LRGGLEEEKTGNQCPKVKKGFWREGAGAGGDTLVRHAGEGFFQGGIKVLGGNSGTDCRYVFFEEELFLFLMTKVQDRDII